MDMQKCLDNLMDRTAFCLGKIIPKGFAKRWEEIFFDMDLREEFAKAQQCWDVESEKPVGLVTEVDAETDSDLEAEKELPVRNEKVEGASWEDMTKNIKW